jgi:hypothetical protein
MLPQLLMFGTFFVVAVIAGAILLSEWWRRYSDHKRMGRVLVAIDLAVAYVLLGFLLLLTPFRSTPFVIARHIGGVMLTPVYLAVHPSELARVVAPRPRPSVSSPRLTQWVGDTAVAPVSAPGPVSAPTRP